MNHKLTRRLFIYFSAALTTFSIVIGALFSLLFLNHIKNNHVEEFRQRALTIAEAIEQNPQIMQQHMERHQMRCRHMSSDKNNYQHHMYCRRTFNNSSMAQYLQELNNLSQSEVWIVDSQSQSYILYGDENSTDYEELPENADEVLKRVFDGEIIISEDFSSILSEPSVTAGVPLKSSGKVTKALLLHRNLSEVQAAQHDSLKIFVICIAAGFFVALILSLILSRRFVKPLKNMEELAVQLTSGNYKARSGIEQDDEIGSLATNLDILAKRLDEVERKKTELDKMKQEFIASVSHELRTPITVIRGSLELLTSGIVNDETKRQNYLNQISDNIISLQRLVNDLFELSRLQSVDFKIEMSELNIFDALNDAIRSAEQIAVKKQIKIICPKLPVTIIKGDYDRLRQMFLIVLDNAVKFSEFESFIEVTIHNANEKLQVDIRDHGCGIAEDELLNIFERFKSHKDNKNPTGTGLGLPIAAAIAKRHKISLTCKNVFDGGACFSFAFK